MGRTPNDGLLNLKTLRLFFTSNLRTQDILHLFYLLICRDIRKSPERYRRVLKFMLDKVNSILNNRIRSVSLVKGFERLIYKEWLRLSAEESTCFIFNKVLNPLRLSLYLLCEWLLKRLLEYYWLAYFFSILIFGILTQCLNKLRFSFLV